MPCDENVLHSTFPLSMLLIEKSALQQKILHSKDFLVLNDKVAEATYDFSMREALENGKEARNNGGVLAGFFFFICKKVRNIMFEFSQISYSGLNL